MKLRILRVDEATKQLYGQEKVIPVEDLRALLKKRKHDNKELRKSWGKNLMLDNQDSFIDELLASLGQEQGGFYQITSCASKLPEKGGGEER